MKFHNHKAQQIHCSAPISGPKSNAELPSITNCVKKHPPIVIDESFTGHGTAHLCHDFGNLERMFALSAAWAQARSRRCWNVLSFHPPSPVITCLMMMSSHKCGLLNLDRFCNLRILVVASAFSVAFELDMIAALNALSTRSQFVTACGQSVGLILRFVEFGCCRFSEATLSSNPISSRDLSCVPWWPMKASETAQVLRGFLLASGALVAHRLWGFGPWDPFFLAMARTMGLLMKVALKT